MSKIMFAACLLVFTLMAGHALAANTCVSTHVIGSGLDRTTVCFTVNGNMVQWQDVNAQDWIGGINGGEGYALCSLNGAVVYGYDAGFSTGGQDGFGASTRLQPNGPNTFPVTFTRETDDGLFRLAMRFERDVQPNQGVRITHTVTNLSAIERKVRVERSFAATIHGGPAGNIGDHTNRSVFVRNDGGLGLMLRVLVPKASSQNAIELTEEWRADTHATCLPDSLDVPTTPWQNHQPLQGYTARVSMPVGAMAPGGQGTATVQYHRY